EGGASGGITQGQGDGFRVLDEGIVDDRHGERLAVLAGGEGQGAGRGGVGGAGRRRGVARRVVGGGRSVSAAGSRDGGGRRALRVVDGVRGRAELQDARLGHVVVLNSQRGRRRAAQRGAAGRAAKRQRDRLVAFHQGVVDDRDGEGLAGLAGGEGQGAGRG